MKNPLRKRWALRDYNDQGKRISEQRYWFKWSAQQTLDMHTALFGRRNPGYQLRLERIA